MDNYTRFLVSSREKLFLSAPKFFQNIATFFNFPTNKGMKVIGSGPYYWSDTVARLIRDESIPARRVDRYPETPTKNYFDIVFGNVNPKPATLIKTFYESKEDGFYAFFIDSYRDTTYLPNEVSYFLQIHCNQCLDITGLEIFHKVLFLILLTYFKLTTLRIMLAWCLTINPYIFPPLSYAITLVDWTESFAAGIIPGINNYGLGTPLIFYLMGKFTDYLNNLVFTMPYLPREAMRGRAFYGGYMHDVTYFRYLPYLWYKEGIPNDIREYWYGERNDILKYMYKWYDRLDMRFMPDQIPDEIHEAWKAHKFVKLPDVNLMYNQISEYTPKTGFAGFGESCEEWLKYYIPWLAEQATNF